MTNIEALAIEAYNIMDNLTGWAWNRPAGEVAPGWVNLVNTWAGQSRTVLHHPESGYVFKNGTGWSNPIPDFNSGQYVGTVTLVADPNYDENIEGTFPVRLPEFYHITVDDQIVEVSEYVEGKSCCSIRGGWCAHAYAMVDATGCEDAHNGNYAIVNGEVVLYDFDGIRL
jgi:hypothetical protein